MKQLKVLFVTHYSGLYGANKSMLALIILLKDKYNVIPYVLVNHDGPLSDELKKNGVKYSVMHYYWWVNYNEGVLQKFINVRKQFLNTIYIKKICNSLSVYNFDLVYSNSITINIGSLIAKRYGVAHFWCVRERLDSYKLKYSLGKLISQFFFKHGADRYFMISKHLIEYYKETIPPKLMTLVYNGVSFAENSYKIDKVKGDSFNICSIGLLSEQKNQLEVLKSVQILINKGVTGFKVYFVGVANSLYYTELISFVNAHNLQSFVEFVGHQNNIDDILQNMDLGLATSVGEAFGRSTIECMLHGIPVVASNSGANLELVVDNFNGSIYQLYNPNDLADKIEKFIKDSNYLRKMGSNAHKYAKEHFSAELNAENVYEIFLSSINEDLDATN